MAYCHRAKSFDESCEGILSRTRGALFLGVPNSLGSSTSWFGECIGKIHRSGYGVDQSASISLANKFSVEFGEMFRTDSETFRELSQSRGWSTFTFYESKETMTRYGPILITGLSEHSSDENIGVLPGDHYTMCRFQTPDDVGFLAVSRRLKLISSGEKDESLHPKPEDLKRGKSVISNILNASQNYSKCLDLFLKELRDNLGSQNFLPAGPEQSAVWINDDDTFQQWARGDVRVLKICGAPGTGKTYLVKHVVSQLTAKHSFKGGQRGDRDVLAHFVDWKPTDRHAPTIVLRSFLFQLLELHPELFKQIYNRIHYPINIYEDLDMLLFDLLSNSRLKGLDIVIHGVDNMDRNSRDLVGGTLSRFISAETRMPDTKVLLTCRKENVFSDEIEAQHHPTVLGLEQVALEGKRDSEVKAYINSCVVTLRNNHKLPNTLAEMIRADLMARTVAQREGANLQSKVSPANISTEPKTRLNNFLWISLVVDLVSSEQWPSKVRNLLKSAEFELVDLFSVYERIIARVPPNYDIVRILRFLQSARRPISLEELAFAIAIRSDHETAVAVEEDRYLSLRGILETFASALIIFQDDSVSLIHPSLSEYLEKLGEDAISRGHNEFAEACLWSLLLGTKKHHAERLLLTDNRLSRHLSPLSFSATPFLRYASLFWFEHVRMALCVNNVGPLLALTVDFLTSDRWESWLTFFRQSTGRDQLPTDRSPIHTFAALNLLNRLEILEKLETGICDRDASKWTPLHYAAANSASESVDFILSQGDLSDTADPELLHLAVAKVAIPLF
ncbi:MAG: hypothetical protein M1840_008960 [Geoglossum simile]|nr:MAG: hypothetical protein M1840_008960 [Geoglossum simile]